MTVTQKQISEIESELAVARHRLAAMTTAHATLPTDLHDEIGRLERRLALGNELREKERLRLARDPYHLQEIAELVRQLDTLRGDAPHAFVVAIDTGALERVRDALQHEIDQVNDERAS
jgi:hypothetical protein